MLHPGYLRRPLPSSRILIRWECAHDASGPLGRGRCGDFSVRLSRLSRKHFAHYGPWKALGIMGPTPGPTWAQLRSVILIFRVFWLENVLFSINDRLGLEAPDIFGLIFVERVQIVRSVRVAEAHRLETADCP